MRHGAKFALIAVLALSVSMTFWRLARQPAHRLFEASAAAQTSSI